MANTPAVSITRVSIAKTSVSHDCRKKPERLPFAVGERAPRPLRRAELELAQPPRTRGSLGRKYDDADAEHGGRAHAPVPPEPDAVENEDAGDALPQVVCQRHAADRRKETQRPVPVRAPEQQDNRTDVRCCQGKDTDVPKRGFRNSCAPGPRVQRREDGVRDDDAFARDAEREATSDSAPHPCGGPAHEDVCASRPDAE